MHVACMLCSRSCAGIWCCTSLPQERSSFCKSINIFPISRESSFSLAESPCGVMWGEVATGNIPNLWEGAMKSMKWAEGSRGPAHLGLLFLSSSVYISYGEKHVLQEEAQQNYHLLGYLDTQCENKAGGRNSTSCIRKGMGAEQQLPVVLIMSCKEAALCKIPSYALWQVFQIWLPPRSSNIFMLIAHFNQYQGHTGTTVLLGSSSLQSTNGGKEDGWEKLPQLWLSEKRSMVLFWFLLNTTSVMFSFNK